MRALLRILVVIPLAYVAACLAAGFVFLVPLLEPAADPDFAMEGFIVGFGFVMAAYGGMIAAAPTLVAVLLAETFGWRSFFFWTLFGGAIGVAVALAGPNVGMGAAGFILPTHAVAGCVGGAIYWLIAGRRSGLLASTASAEP